MVNFLIVISPLPHQMTPDIYGKRRSELPSVGHWKLISHCGVVIVYIVMTCDLNIWLIFNSFNQWVVDI